MDSSSLMRSSHEEAGSSHIPLRTSPRPGDEEEDNLASPSHRGMDSSFHPGGIDVSAAPYATSPAYSPGGGQQPTYTTAHIAAPSPLQPYGPGTLYRSEHYRDYPMAAQDRERIAVEAQAVHLEEMEERDNQSRMLTDSLTQDSGGSGPPMLPDSRLHSSLEIEDEDENEVVYRFPVKSALVALALLLLGLTCLILGIIHIVTGAAATFAFILIGAILVIPGSYQTYMIYHAWRRTPGFSFNQLAAFEGFR